MKKKVMYLVFFILVFPPTLVFSQKKEKAPDNFRGIKWGADIKTLSGFKDTGWAPNDIPEYKDEKRYRRNENKNVGEIKVDEIEYKFYKGRFCSGIIFFKDASKYSFLKDALDLKYGKGSKYVVEGVKELENCFRWNFDDVEMMISYSQGEGMGRLIYNYKPIDHECTMAVLKFLLEKHEGVIRKLKDDL